jgi:hypothetical protein
MPPSRFPGHQPGAKEAGSGPLQLCTHHNARAAQCFRKLSARSKGQCRPRASAVHFVMRECVERATSRRIARSYARALGSARSGDAHGAVTRWRATLIVMRRSICIDRSLLGSKRVLPPDWGARGARGSFGGRHPFLRYYVSIGSKLLIFRSRPFVRSTQVAVSSPRTSPVRSSFGGGAQALIGHNLEAETSCPLGAVVRWREARTR